jgi:purine-binding chemotaxis protein CheW
MVQTERQLVALHLGSEIYGVDISCIHTVLMPQPITTVPQTPDYVQGVMNLRGRIIPVVDLRVRFGLESTSTDKTRIVIIEVEGLTAGLIVDSVSEVLRLSEASIETPSALLASTVAECITGIGRSNSKSSEGKDQDRLILLLDVYRLLAGALGDTDLLSDMKAA